MSCLHFQSQFSVLCHLLIEKGSDFFIVHFLELLKSLDGDNRKMIMKNFLVANLRKVFRKV